ncbi:hypothetical protein A3J78_00070 [Candidatus Beckwithbacteria bacterium RBG_13_35_6]|uniref:HEAT repeat domain-containing protein n=1 Tax=Candidatus Beckwithbacteria bacterium RBG_13_35_6 TaxID=1797456 RepID=A0A1F5DH58_9BACT|nr:MAG: hypothetical protein A3J78_00070 [Candidatus Beckwithbacteria bacterium RBG_13_35_6]
MILKKLFKYFFIGAVVVFILFFLITSIIIGIDVKKQCQEAEAEYQGDCVEVLMQTLDDESNSLRQRNLAIWALGQLGDKKALPILRKYYTGQIPDKEPYDKTLSQYELKKAIKLLEDGLNLTAFIWRRTPSLSPAILQARPSVQAQATKITVSPSEYALRQFFTLANNKQLDQALAIVSSSLIANDTEKNKLRSYLSSLKNIEIKNIKSLPAEGCACSRGRYQVSFSVSQNPLLINKIPIFFGWKEGINNYDFEMLKYNMDWKINKLTVLE